MGIGVVLDVGHIGDHEHAEFILKIMQPDTDAQGGLIERGTHVDILLPVVGAQQVERHLN